MLTGDLVRGRRRDGSFFPAYLRGAAAERMLPVAAAYTAILEGMVGASRDTVDAALDAVTVPARDRVAALGLRKVLEDRAEFEVAADVDPEALRHEVFLAAAAAHRALDVKAELDRAAVLAEVAARLATTPAALEAGLYADLRGSELLLRFRPLDAASAVERYNVGLAQAVLLRATRVTLRLDGEEPDRYRRIFRAARFHGLLHVVRRGEDGAYTVELDGPYSLFDAVQRYGLKLALFLPSVLPCARFHLHADLLWGKERAPLGFSLDAAEGLVSHAAELPASTPELDAFRAAFERLGSEWSVAPNERIFALPGEVVCVPDLVFARRAAGAVKAEKVYLEVFGFWSRAAVWQRVELLRKGFPARILLAVGKQLRVSEEVLGDDDAGELYVYKAALSPRAVLERLRRA